MADKEPVVALVDGDTIAFRAASATQNTIEDSNGIVMAFTIRAEAEAAVDHMINRIMYRLGNTHLKVFLSCPDEDNWRLKVDPSYKSNRKGSIRPQMLDDMKDYLRFKYGAEHLAYLEADDALGIYATSETLLPGEKIVVGRDKDFATIPGKHYQLGDDLPNGKPIIRTFNAMEAAKAHYAQALSGDAVDGYEGCPGVGKTRALRIVEDPHRLIPKDGVITRGVNKGLKVTKWHQDEKPSSIWEAVVSHYEKAGLGEADAMKSARLAKILLAEDYNMETHEVTLWVPGEE